MKEFKRYERYKDSGVEWIREIPEHWKTTRLKYLKKSPFMYGANESAELDNPNLPRFIRITDIDFNGNLKEETFKSLPLELAEPYLLEEGDILFARSGASVGKTFIYERKWGPACFAGYLIRFQTDESKAIPKFIYYFCQTSIYEDWIKENTIQSTIQNVSAEKYSSLILPVPPLNTQNIIVNYLDQKTAEIDSLIADKEKLIELLQEQRQAIITQAVTKGLNPNVRMKDSGIEWLGEIPVHWEVKPLKRLTSFISRGITPTYVDVSSVKVINQACIYWEKLNIENIKYQKEDLDISKGRLYKGDLVINSTGTGTLGRAAIFNLEGSCIADTHVTIIRSDKNSLNNRYLFYLLQTPKYQSYIYSALVTGATNQIELSREGLQNTIIICPFIEEQQAIANFLDQKTTEIDLLISDIKTQIFSLKEYRQSLITAAVTGKIDVRNYNIKKNQMKGEEQEEVS